MEKTMFKKDEEKLFEQIVHQGRHKAIDSVCHALQLALKKKGG